MWKENGERLYRIKPGAKRSSGDGSSSTTKNQARNADLVVGAKAAAKRNAAGRRISWQRCLHQPPPTKSMWLGLKHGPENGREKAKKDETQNTAAPRWTMPKEHRSLYTVATSPTVRQRPVL